MEYKRRHIIKNLFYELIHTFNILSEDMIMNRFDRLDIDHTMFYFNKSCFTYFKEVIEIHGWTNPGKINQAHWIHPH